VKIGTRSSEATGTKKVTIKNVAALSGVSYQTVSRVINGMPDVSDRTRKRRPKGNEKGRVQTEHDSSTTQESTVDNSRLGYIRDRLLRSFAGTDQ
jgi:hypothetical protein